MAASLVRLEPMKPAPPVMRSFMIYVVGYFVS
jgi:hypothetical protein